jgi:hypothetical protein
MTGLRLSIIMVRCRILILILMEVTVNAFRNRIVNGVSGSDDRIERIRKCRLPE